MFSSSDLIQQLVDDRQQDLLGSRRRQERQPSRVRRLIARSLRRAADRLDQAAATPGSASGALPGRGETASGVSGLAS